jgi:hypothetical protein
MVMVACDHVFVHANEAYACAQTLLSCEHSQSLSVVASLVCRMQ